MAILHLQPYDRPKVCGPPPHQMRVFRCFQGRILLAPVHLSDSMHNPRDTSTIDMKIPIVQYPMEPVHCFTSVKVRRLQLKKAHSLLCGRMQYSPRTHSWKWLFSNVGCSNDHRAGNHRQSEWRSVASAPGIPRGGPELYLRGHMAYVTMKMGLWNLLGSPWCAGDIFWLCFVAESHNFGLYRKRL